MMTRKLKWGAVSLICVVIVPSTVLAVTYCTGFNSGLVTTILNGFDPCGFYANTFSDAIEQCGDETFQVAGPAGTQVQCNFCFWAEFAGFENEGGLVALDEIPVPPGSPGFRNAALSAPSSTIIFGGLGAGNQEPGATTTLTLDANRTYIFWLVQNNTRTAALANPNIAVFFSLVGANFDNFDHLNSLTSAQNGGATVFAWEDLTGGGDQDFSDHVFTSRCEFIGTPLCEPVEDPDVRTQGFWKRQCRGPHPSGEHDNLSDYVDCVNDTATFEDVVDVDGLCDRLRPNPKNDKCEQAKAQFMALTLNLCSKRVETCNCIDDPDFDTVGEAAEFVDGLLSNPARTRGDCVQAQAIADGLNNGLTLADCP